MKIMQVNNLYGDKSTGKLTRTLHEGLLRLGIESLVVYGRGKSTKDPGVIRLCPDWYGKLNSAFSRFTGIPYGGCLMSTFYLTKIIRKHKPDVVHLQCINGNFVNIYRLISWLKKNGIKTVVSLHAEFMYTGNCGHAFDCMQWRHGCSHCPKGRRINKGLFFERTADSWKKMQKAFSGFGDNCVVCPVSKWTEERVKQSDILGNFRCQTVLNGIETKDTFFSILDIPQKKNTVLHVTACFSGIQGHPKGGWYLIQLARRMPNVRFLVAGRTENAEELPSNVSLLGDITDQKKLAQLYREAKVSLLVSQRETFSLPCAESLCCGTPVVGFEAGAPEQISLPEFSEFVPFGDVEALEKCLLKWLNRSDLNREQIAECACSVYSAQTMIQSFLDVYRSWL